MVKLLDKIDVSDGAITRSIALYEGEITALSPEQHADILIVSAFPEHYAPTTTSLIGALDRSGVSVGELAASKLYDLRATSAFWLSKPLANASLNIGQIACFEPSELGTPPELVGNLFRGLFPFLDDRRGQVVAMPVLATGDQGWPGEQMLSSILEAATHWLGRGLPIKELKIIERTPGRAAELAGVMAAFKAMLPVTSLKTSAVNDFDVFLSFSSADAEAADCVKRELEKRGDAKRVFDFRLAIDKGKAWQDELDLAISSSSSIVTILTPAYFASPECREELMQARLRNKRSERPVLFPIYWRDWGRDLDLWLQLVNFADCRERNFEILRSTMGKLALA